MQILFMTEVPGLQTTQTNPK